MSLPVDDWQFWAATALALGALWLLVRPFLARPKKGACPGCPSNAGKAAARGTATTLSIEGRRVR